MRVREVLSGGHRAPSALRVIFVTTTTTADQCRSPAPPLAAAFTHALGQFLAREYPNVFGAGAGTPSAAPGPGIAAVQAAVSRWLTLWTQSRGKLCRPVEGTVRDPGRRRLLAHSELERAYTHAFVVRVRESGCGALLMGVRRCHEC